MHFGLTPDVRELADAVRDVLQDQCPPHVVREQWDAAPGVVPEHVATLWRTIADVGLPMALVPEQDGGLGLDEVGLVALMEQIGRSAVPLPVLESVVLAPVLAVHADVAVGQSAVAWAPDGQYAPWGEQADLIVSGGARGTSMGLTEPARGAGGRSTAAVDAGRPMVAVSPPSRSLAVPEPERRLLWNRASLAGAAELVGLARAMIDLTVEYVKVREQFGVPVGSFQAIKHHLADAEIEYSFARPLVLLAAWNVSQSEADLADGYVAMAKARCGRAAVRIARSMFQCHGGMGFTTEYDLHFFAKRAWALSASFGTTTHHVDAVVESLPQLMHED